LSLCEDFGIPWQTVANRLVSNEKYVKKEIESFRTVRQKKRKARQKKGRAFSII